MAGNSIGRYAAFITADVAGFVAGMGKARAEVGTFQASIKSIKGMGTELASAFAGPLGFLVGGASVAGVATAFKELAAGAHETVIASRQMDTSITNVKELAKAARHAGLDMGDVSTAVMRMRRTIADAAKGDQAAVEALSQVGLNATNLVGLDLPEQLERVRLAIMNVKDATMRTGAEMDIFGRGGARFEPFLQQGVGKSQVNEEAIKAMSEAQVALEDFWASMKSGLTTFFGMAVQGWQKLKVDVGMALPVDEIAAMNEETARIQESMRQEKLFADQKDELQDYIAGVIRGQRELGRFGGEIVGIVQKMESLQQAMADVGSLKELQGKEKEFAKLRAELEKASAQAYKRDMDAQRENQDAIAREIEGQNKAGRKAFDDARTDVEKYKDSLRDIESLRSKGLISGETAERLRNKEARDFLATQRGAAAPQGVDPTTAQGWSHLVDMQYKALTADTQDREIQQLQEEHLKDIREELRGIRDKLDVPPVLEVIA